MTANAAWAKECAACHIAFHPSLLPADSWNKVMDTLPDHFGEDASLDEVTTAEIKTFLAANSAEHWDTLPANRLRSVDPAKPTEITATRFWTRMHGEIDTAVFESKPVGAKQNCVACHGDAASGMFAPQNISIPKEMTP
jgi:cytochrome c